MPSKPLRPCRQPGCPSLIRGGGWCDAHKPAAWASTTTSAASRGYGPQWRRLRAIVLDRDPVCKGCGKAASMHVDHVVPKARGGTDAIQNLQGLCERCHQAKTARDARNGKRLRPGPRTPTP